jgi:hypothetical protein
MKDTDTILISSDGPERIIGAMDAVMPQLAPDVRRRFNKIKLRYWQLYGVDGLHERVNNRTVSRILVEYDADEPKPIASGQLDDTRYELFEAPDASKNEPSEPGSEPKAGKEEEGKEKGSA